MEIKIRDLKKLIKEFLDTSKAKSNVKSFSQSQIQKEASRLALLSMPQKYAKLLEQTELVKKIESEAIKMHPKSSNLNEAIKKEESMLTVIDPETSSENSIFIYKDMDPEKGYATDKEITINVLNFYLENLETDQLDVLISSFPLNFSEKSESLRKSEQGSEEDPALERIFNPDKEALDKRQDIFGILPEISAIVAFITSPVAAIPGILGLMMNAYLLLSGEVVSQEILASNFAALMPLIISFVIIYMCNFLTYYSCLYRAYNDINKKDALSSRVMSNLEDPSSSNDQLLLSTESDILEQVRVKIESIKVERDIEKELERMSKEEYMEILEKLKSERPSKKPEETIENVGEEIGSGEMSEEEREYYEKTYGFVPDERGLDRRYY